MAELGSVKIRVTEGNLADFKTDVIVNSTSEELRLSLGFLSRSILKRAGSQIQAECAEKYPRGIEPGQIAVTQGYGLKCRYVFHGALPAWDDADMDGSCKVLKDIICTCLKLAHENNLKSIAFPALGCGFLGYPADVASSTLFQSVALFNSSMQPSSLKQVSVVILAMGGDWKLVQWTFLRELHGPVGEYEKFPGRKLQAKKQGRSGGIFSAVLRSFMKSGPEDMDVSDGPDDVEVDGPVPPKPALQRFSTSVRLNASNLCTKVLPCGHGCLGYKGEATCPPCLQPECHPPGQTAEDDCIICYTDPLMAAPVCMLGCAHVYHLHCVQRILENRWIGPRITFNFALCPICKKSMENPMLDPLLKPIRELYNDVSRKARLRAEFENLSKTPAAMGSPYFGDVLQLALERYCYYPCNKCGKAYFGGMAQCEDGAAGGPDIDEEELVCGACSGQAGQAICPIHKLDFIEYKCRYCCSIAMFFCFGTTHFCNGCHNNAWDIAKKDQKDLPKCPAGPNCVQLSGDCPLGIKHPPNGEEMCLGCGLCSNLNSF